MVALALLVRGINALNEWVGRAVSWLTLGVVLVCFTVVVLRYVFQIGFVWMQDLYVWMHGIAFTLGAAYTLRHDRHVRVDIFYRPSGARYKAWVDLIGAFVFLLPFVAVVIYYSLDYVGRSWALRESSLNVGGMPGLYWVKSCLIGFAVLLGLQGLAMAARSVLLLTGNKGLVAQADLPQED